MRDHHPLHPINSFLPRLIDSFVSEKSNPFPYNDKLIRTDESLIFFMQAIEAIFFSIAYGVVDDIVGSYNENKPLLFYNGHVFPYIEGHFPAFESIMLCVSQSTSHMTTTTHGDFITQYVTPFQRLFTPFPGHFLSWMEMIINIM